MLNAIMLNVANKPFMVSVIRLNVIIRGVIMLNVANKPIMLNGIMRNVANKPLTVSVIMLNVVMLGVIMLNVVAPRPGACTIKHYESIIYRLSSKLACLYKLGYL
jgi:hypothetical protein